VPAELDELIVEMLAKDAGDRPHSMTDVEERLRDLLDTMDVPPQPRQWRPSGANKASTSAEFPVLKTPAPRQAGEPSAATAKTVDTAASNSGAIAVAPPAPAPAPRKLVRWPFLAGGAAALAIALVIGIALGRAGSSHDEPAAPAAVALPAPAAAPIPTAPPPAPKPPASVKIRFTSTPQGATVRLDGSATPLGTTPFTATLPRSDTPASVIVEKPGFAPITEPLELASDGALSASLSAAPAPAVATKPVEHKPQPVPKHPPATQRPLDRGGTMDVFGGK
jgi:hypothetical protein